VSSLDFFYNLSIVDIEASDMNLVSNNLVDLAENLKRLGISPTKQRIAIGEVIFSRNQHISAEQILEKAQKADASVSKATVYNTLNLFVEKKIVRELIIDRSKVFYDPNTDFHHHIYNVDTGEIRDISAESLSVTGLPDLPIGVQLEGADVVIRVRSKPVESAVSV
jgi:Fur family iron response transcriptional regulator